MRITPPSLPIWPFLSAVLGNYTAQALRIPKSSICFYWGNSKGNRDFAERQDGHDSVWLVKGRQTGGGGVSLHQAVTDPACSLRARTQWGRAKGKLSGRQACAACMRCLLLAWTPESGSKEEKATTGGVSNRGVYMGKMGSIWHFSRALAC